MGSCLSSILQLAGSPYWPDHTDAVLLLELPDQNAPGTGISLELARCAMVDLVLAGVIGQVAAMVVGRQYRYDETVWAQWEAMTVEMCAGMSFPFPLIQCGCRVGIRTRCSRCPLGVRS